MAWTTTLVTMVRHLVSDLSVGEERYEDSRIREALVMAGILTSRIYKFDNDYTFDISGPTISPDPTLTATLDNDAIALFTLRTACMLDVARLQDNADNIGVIVRDENTLIDTKSNDKGYQSILDNGPCSSYYQLLEKLESDKSMSVGKAVVTPGTHPDRVSYYSASETARFFFDNYLRSART